LQYQYCPDNFCGCTIHLKSFFYTLTIEATIKLPVANKETLNITTAKIIFDVDLLILNPFVCFDS